jgi:hypothetical protein
MNDRDGFEGYPCFRKLEDDTTSSTIAEGKEPVGVNIRRREEQVQRYATNSPHASFVGQEGHGPGEHRVGPPKKRLTTVKVHCERYIAMRGEIISAAPLVVVKTNAVVSNENCGPKTLAMWPCQMGDHLQTVCFLKDFGSCDFVHIVYG